MVLESLTAIKVKVEIAMLKSKTRIWVFSDLKAVQTLTTEPISIVVLSMVLSISLHEFII